MGAGPGDGHIATSTLWVFSRKGLVVGRLGHSWDTCPQIAAMSAPFSATWILAQYPWYGRESIRPAPSGQSGKFRLTRGNLSSHIVVQITRGALAACVFPAPVPREVDPIASRAGPSTNLEPRTGTPQRSSLQIPQSASNSNRLGHRRNGIEVCQGVERRGPWESSRATTRCFCA